MKTFSLLLTLLLAISGCATSGPTLQSGIDPAGNPICLTDCKEIPSAIDAYLKNHDLITEEDEIDYLFYRIRTSQRRFIRNGEEHDGGSAAQFLRWKIERHKQKFDDPIKTDEDFVLKILEGSKTTGKPYEVIMPDGTKHNLQFVMVNELNYLERHEGETPDYPSTFLQNKTTQRIAER